MVINPVLRMRPPAPLRRIWQRRVESTGSVAPASEGALGDHRLSETEAGLDTPQSRVAEPEPGPVYETSPLADGTLAGMNALRAADAEVAARALLAGAKAHGPIDLAHLKLILQHLDEIGATAADRTYVLAHLRDQTDLEELLNAVHDRTTAQETYHLAASMIDPAKAQEAEWLAALRDRLRERVARFV